MNEFLSTINILNNNIIVELRNEIANKPDVDGMREGMLRGGSGRNDQTGEY